MLRNTNLYLGVALASYITLIPVSRSNAAVVYSENFENMTVDAAIPVNATNIGFGFVTAVANANDPSNKLVVRSPLSPPGNGLTAENVNWSGNKFGEWHDNDITATGNSVRLEAQFAPLSASPYSISFDYYEPSGYPAMGGNPGGNGNIFAVVTGTTANLNTTGNRSVNVIFGDPTAEPASSTQFQTNPAAAEGILDNRAALDTKHTLQIFGNLGTGGTLTYKSGTESVANNTYDVWLNGVRIFNDVANRNAHITWSKLGFILGSSLAGTDVKYLDNIVITNDLIGPPVPGDLDTDGDVDGADFATWQAGFPNSSGANLMQGDADGDGDVDGADFIVWQTHFPTATGPGIESIPEPSAIVLLLYSAILAKLYMILGVGRYDFGEQARNLPRGKLLKLGL